MRYMNLQMDAPNASQLKSTKNLTLTIENSENLPSKNILRIFVITLVYHHKIQIVSSGRLDVRTRRLPDMQTPAAARSGRLKRRCESELLRTWSVFRRQKIGTMTLQDGCELQTELFVYRCFGSCARIELSGERVQVGLPRALSSVA